MNKVRLDLVLTLGHMVDEQIKLSAILDNNLRVQEALRPVKGGDLSGMASMFNDSFEVRRGIYLAREEFAKLLSRELVDSIMKILSERDLFNGYTKDQLLPGIFPDE